MAKRTIIWSKTAYQQRKKILIYWLERNKSNVYPIKLLNQTEKATQLLADFPEIGKPTDFESVRIFIMGNYSIFYSFDELLIKVIVFWDNRQNPDTLKKILS